MPDDDAQPLPPLGDFRPTRLDDEVPAGGASVALKLPDVDLNNAPPRQPRSLIGDGAATLAACAGHALLALALLSPPSTIAGSGGISGDAISISMISAKALEAQTPGTNQSAADAAELSPTVGDNSTVSTEASDTPAPPKPQAEAPVTDTAEIEDRTAAPAEPAPEATPDEAPVITSAPARAEPLPHERPTETTVAAAEPPPEARERPPEKPDAAPAPDAATAGGDPSRGTAAEQAPQSAAAAASRGEVHAYGHAVQSALLAVDQRATRTRLASAQAKGTVIVRIAIRADGTLDRAEIATSSGRPQLDEAALILIRLATFPPAPPGLTGAERTYHAPIRFQ